MLRYSWWQVVWPEHLFLFFLLSSPSLRPSLSISADSWLVPSPDWLRLPLSAPTLLFYSSSFISSLLSVFFFTFTFSPCRCFCSPLHFLSIHLSVSSAVALLSSKYQGERTVSHFSGTTGSIPNVCNKDMCNISWTIWESTSLQLHVAFQLLPNLPFSDLPGTQVLFLS